jgi:hypothetical protein
MSAVDQGASSVPAKGARRLDLRYLGLTVLFVAVELALTAVHAPKLLAWHYNAFADAGANLTIEYLTQHGDRPGIDNGYIYGLLCLGFGHVWCGLLGLTPYASFVAWALGNVLMGWGMSRFAYYARVGPVGLALMLVQMVPGKDQTFVYIMEPVFLIHALAEQARGRREVALALVTACAFVKPSLASVYGLVLVVTILASRVRPGPGDFLRRIRGLLPATAVGVMLLVILGTYYGVPALVRSLVPVHAAAIYRANHFGFFFGTGRGFWYFPKVTPFYYLGTPVAFWLAGSVVLILGAIAGLLAPPDRPVRNREIVATCAILHAVFTCFFFAHRFSYDYYYYILVMGLAALSPRSRLTTAAVACLVVLGLVGNRGHILATIRGLQDDRRGEHMAGLFAQPGEFGEWQQVRELIRGRRAGLLAVSDGAALMIPEFYPPTIYFVAPTELTPLEIERKLAQLRSADVVVEVAALDGTWISDRYPIFRPPLDEREVIYRSKHYRVLAHSKDGTDRPAPARE